MTTVLSRAVHSFGCITLNPYFFDTLTIQLPYLADDLIAGGIKKGINIRKVSENVVCVSMDETVSKIDMRNLINLFATSSFEQRLLKGHREDIVSLDTLDFVANASKVTREDPAVSYPVELKRDTEILQHPIFNKHHSETEMLRYLTHLQKKDLSLADAMIPLGSCTMKLNGTVEMIPVTMPEFGALHPFVPLDQAKGYRTLFRELEYMLEEATGFDKICLQPNSGAQGEYAGLCVIRAYLDSIGQSKRNVCLIPVSAHGTNPASAVMAGMQVVTVKCLPTGNLDLEDLKLKAEAHKEHLAAAMITYPSTYGVFEEQIKDAFELIHKYGGQVYMDGANLNAQLGLCKPAEIGADVCHLNLHKTFCIPHGTIH